MFPIIVKPFTRLTISEYHRITQAREGIFYLEQRATCPDADHTDPQCVFMSYTTKPPSVGYWSMPVTSAAEYAAG